MLDVARFEAVRTEILVSPYRPPPDRRSEASVIERLAERLGSLAEARRHPVGRLILQVAGVLAVALGLVWLFYSLGGGDKESAFTKLGFETAKMAVQLVFAGVVGGVLIQEYNRGRARRAAANEFRKQVLHSLIAAYSDVKKVRRVLRARSTRCHHRTVRTIGIPGAVYDSQMAEINDVQIRLEIVARELRVFKDPFQNVRLLVPRIVKMEKYLGRLVSEYERSRKEPSGCECVPLDVLPHVQGLIAARQLGVFQAGFADHFRAALTLIERERVRVL